MESKIIIGLIFVFFSITCQAQKKDKFIPLDMKKKTHSFALPALQIENIFMENLNAVLFDKDDCYMNSIISNPNNVSSG